MYICASYVLWVNFFLNKNIHPSYPLVPFGELVNVASKISTRSPPPRSIVKIMGLIFSMQVFFLWLWIFWFRLTDLETSFRLSVIWIVLTWGWNSLTFFMWALWTFSCFLCCRIWSGGSVYTSLLNDNNSKDLLLSCPLTRAECFLVPIDINTHLSSLTGHSNQWIDIILNF